MELLDKKRLFEILKSRFTEGFFTLSSLPSPVGFKDMQKAAKRVAEAIKRGEKIAVVGDYDVDGVVSCAIMKEFFQIIEYPLKIKIPNRFTQGYGLSVDIIKELEDEVSLIITVDNGISAYEAAEYCKSRGIDLIVTDHHTPKETLPEAFAIVNPKQRECDFGYKDICGAQVAWYFVAQLKKELGVSVDMRRFLDLLSIAIIADVMPLRHINRTLVQAGLKFFQKSERPSVRFLMRTLKKSIFTSEDIGFVIAPVLNSAGRMDDASLALDFLLSRDFLESSVLYGRLLALNSQRKSEERRVFSQAEGFVDDEPFILAYSEGWNEGVLGIVAARLAAAYERPAIVLVKEGDTLKGSARSYADIDLYEIISGCSSFLERFGGHKKAAGLTLKWENLESFRECLKSGIESIDPLDWEYEEEVLGELPFDQIDWELLDILDMFAPYGEGNPMPRFAARGVEILDFKEVGEKKEHLLLTLRQRGRVFKAIRFKNRFEPNGNRIDIVYHPRRNEFNSNVNIQLNLHKIS